MYYLFSRTMILSNLLITQNVPDTAEILRCSHSSSENQEHAECCSGWFMAGAGKGHPFLYVSGTQADDPRGSAG